ncbi:TerB family tellurite resistance protein [Undibacterium sp. TC4M20W]|uniref:TerB family tellurite resistance protein n=1 Tax=Undibacterium sp. TC4M20W TaxID=3413052 RepID=UPI003BF06F7A
MFPFFAPQSLSDSAIIAASKIMLQVAKTDDIHPAESALIKSFYEGSISTASHPSFDELLAAADAYKLAASDFATEQEREMVVALSVMTGFADGTFSDAETQAVRDIAAALNLAPGRFDEINETIKDHMLAQLSHLPDAGSVAVVAKELG